jgi:hypothetical protein
MTQEQINYLDFSVNIQFRVLLLVKSKIPGDEWTQAFNDIVDETKDKIIWDLENFLLLPTYTFKPLSRNFREEDIPIRQEIALEVNNRFQSFIQEQNGRI